MRLIIAEKPSVARAIAAEVGATVKEQGALSGPGIKVSWAYGHLVTIAPAEVHGFSTNWESDTLPIFPASYQLQVSSDKTARLQFDILVDLIRQATEVVCATDAAREGELIFRYIYSLAGGKAPVKRLWISSLTPEAIQVGLTNLRPGSDYDYLYLAAKARSEADYLVGMNLTRAMTVRHKQTVNKLISLGRVQTPTLSLICSRFQANKDFKIAPFWVPTVDLSYSDANQTYPTFTARYTARFTSRPEAERILHQLEQLTGSEKKLDLLDRVDKPQTLNPPLLFDLTTAQRVANVRLGLSAETTLSLVQQLYEDGHVTYPRTDSQYLSDDMQPEVKLVLASLQSGLQQEPNLGKNPFSTRAFNDKKVTDHHAIIPTRQLAPLAKLTEDAKAIYLLIVERFLQAFSQPSLQTKTIFTIGKTGKEPTVLATGITVTEPGWKSITLLTKSQENSEPDDEEESNQRLPPAQTGAHLSVSKVSLVEGKTVPPTLLTEASLLGLMETAGQRVSKLEETDPDLVHDDIAPFSLGTPATRASIIETLLKREYIIRSKKKLTPTPFGLAIWQLTKELPIGQPLTTGKWEYALTKIQSGLMTPQVFEQRLQTMISSTVVYINQDTNQISQQAVDTICCPSCKKGIIQKRASFYGCTQYVSGCKFTLPLTMLGKSLSLSIVKLLCDKKRTTLIKGFQGKKPFDACLILQEDLKLGFEFEKKH
jgi:DNA topoisomerase-3